MTIAERLAEIRELLLDATDLEQVSWRTCVLATLRARGKLIGSPHDRTLYHGVRYVLDLPWDASLMDPSLVTTDDFFAAVCIMGHEPVHAKLVAVDQLLARYTKTREVEHAL
jgi:hypothetical protein